VFRLKCHLNGSGLGQEERRQGEADVDRLTKARLMVDAMKLERWKKELLTNNLQPERREVAEHAVVGMTDLLSGFGMI